MKRMKTYYIYMIELRLEGKLNNDESYFYIGKTDNIVARLITHIVRNRKTTKLIRVDGKNIASVIAIREIHEIIFNDEEKKSFKSMEDDVLQNKIDSITSKIENKFVYGKIDDGQGNIDKNKRRYRGGHYTSEWGSPSESYKLKKICQYDLSQMKLVLNERYVIEDKFYKEYKEQEKEKYIMEIKEYIQEKSERVIH